MSANSSIEWTKYTSGPWLGCTEVSPGCANCYARKLLEERLSPIIRKAYRLAGFDDWATRPVWGNKAPRVLTKGFWSDARTWNRAAGKSGVRERIFPSMIDWLDEMPAGILDQEGNWLDRDQVFADFLAVVHECQNLDWQLLTKRPENWLPRLRLAAEATKDLEHWEWIRNWLLNDPPRNIWLGVSVENQAAADERIPQLLQIPAAIRFLSCEPLLGTVDLSKWIEPWDNCGYCGESFDFDTERFDVCPACKQSGCMGTAFGSEQREQYDAADGRFETREDCGVDWVICGGESGPNARPMHPDWACSLRDQCQAAGVPFFFKQWGEFAPVCAQYPRTEAEHEENERTGCCGDIALEPDGVIAEGYQPGARTWLMDRVGKKNAGRQLDGREWSEFPLPSTLGVGRSALDVCL